MFIKLLMNLSNRYPFIYNFVHSMQSVFKMGFEGYLRALVAPNPWMHKIIILTTILEILYLN
jgi:hypothetical protein